MDTEAARRLPEVRPVVVLTAATSENLQAEKSACGRRMRIDKIEKLYKLYSTYSKVDYEKVAYFLQWSSIIIKFVQRESPIDIK